MLNGEFDGFEWNQQKSSTAYDERGFDFGWAAQVFFDVYVERESLRDGEPRFSVTGIVDGAIITVVWTPRGRNRRIISARLASKKERREYREHRDRVAGPDP